MQDLSWLSPLANVVNSANPDSLTVILGLGGVVIILPILYYTFQCAAGCMREAVDLALKAALALLVVAIAMVVWQATASPWLKEAFQIDHSTTDSADMQRLQAGGFPIYPGKPNESDKADYISLALESKDGKPMYYRIPKWSHKVDGGGPWVRLVKAAGSFDTTGVMVGLVTDLAWRGVTSLASVPFGLAARLSDALLKASGAVGEASTTTSDPLCASSCAETLKDCPKGVRCMCPSSEMHMSLADRLWATFGMGDSSESLMGTEKRPCLSPAGDKIGLCQCGGGGDDDDIVVSHEFSDKGLEPPTYEFDHGPVPPPM